MSGSPDFVTLESDEFTYGSVGEVAPGVRRVIAHNPSKFTYRGTGTYLVGEGDIVVIDPGPILDSHRDALVSAIGSDTVRAILVTHCHADHSPLAAWLCEETGAPTVAFGPHHPPGAELWDIGSDPEGFGIDDSDDAGRSDRTDGSDDSDAPETDGDEPVIEESVDTAFEPDHAVVTGDEVASGSIAGRPWQVSALHTPGHTSNHTCFVFDSGESRVLFSGDHVMGWSTTVVAPPDGDMASYIESLRVVAGRDDDLLIPTHGSPVVRPQRFVEQLIVHRLDREQAVLAAVRSGTDTVQAIVTDLYSSVPITLHRPAARSVLAHLIKLVDDGLVAVDGAAAGDDVGRPRLDSRYGAV